jgi:phosphate transport system ATP-binding protein
MTQAQSTSGPVAADVQADRAKESGQRVEAMARMKVDVGGGGKQLLATDTPALFEVQDLNCYYGDFRAVRDVTMSIPMNRITAFIGPSGCGKSTLLRWFNRMNDLVPSAHITGSIKYHGVDLNDDRVDPVEVRRRIGMVFQKPNPFPKSIRENILFGARISGYKGDKDELVERSLRRAAIWDEVKDKLDQPGTALSGGQQQRLCIARTVAVRPEIILFDEPCSALDPISTAKIEELIDELKEDYTIAIVTHNMQQAARVSDYTAFMYLGEMVEFDDTTRIFTSPSDPRTQDYITGRFG